LAARVARLIAVEIDRDLAASLSSRVPPHVRIVEADFLKVDIPGLLTGERAPLRVVANLPYNVASPILFALLHAADEGRLLRDATLMLQREVADRIVAQPGDRAYGAMAVQVARLAAAARVLTLPPGAFRPPPKVTSAVVRLTFRASPVEIVSAELFEQVVRGAFLQRRKTIANALQPVARIRGRSAAELLSRTGLDGGKRPEALTLADFAALTRAML
jgi:16S rRNA (adenine1518-N6/adenine1519-N6)-dimethyltransferase